MRNKKVRLIHRTWLAAVLITASALLAAAQTASPSKVDVQEKKLASTLMGRDMPYRVLLPLGYSEAKNTLRYPVVYLLHGLGGSYANWTDKTKLAIYATAHNFIIVTPEGENGWYTDSPDKPMGKYESYIVKELLPEIDRTYRTVADRNHRFIAGLSMGGFGAVKFGMKYPAMFSLVGSFSGAVGAASYTSVEQLPAGFLRQALVGVFGEPTSETHKANDLYSLARALTPEQVKALPMFYIACGTEDFVFQNNRDLSGIFLEKKVAHEYRERPGVHDWNFWNDQVREFLDVVERSIKK